MRISSTEQGAHPPGSPHVNSCLLPYRPAGELVLDLQDLVDVEVGLRQRGLRLVEENCGISLISDRMGRVISTAYLCHVDVGRIRLSASLPEEMGHFPL